VALLVVILSVLSEQQLLHVIVVLVYLLHKNVHLFLLLSHQFVKGYSVLSQEGVEVGTPLVTAD
jgi:hypothetical protein